MHVARRAAAQILHLGRDPQGAVLELLVFLHQPDDDLVVAGVVVRRSFGACSPASSGKALFVRLVAHRVSVISFRFGRSGFPPDIDVRAGKIKAERGQ